MDINSLAKHIKPFDIDTPPAISDREKEYFRYYGLDFEDRLPDIVHYFGHLSSEPFEIVVHYFHNKNAIETCFLVHGYYDHAGLYRHLIEYCLKRNFSVVIYDLPGHGLSTGERASIASFDQYQQVLRDVLRYFSSRISKPWHAIGQSTGGAILTEFLLHGGDAVFYKIVLLAPLVYPTNWRASRCLYEVLKFFCRSIPRRFVVNSGDRDFLRFVECEDPLQHQRLTVRWVGALVAWIDRFHRFEPREKSVLIVQGLQDETVDWQRNIPLLQAKISDVKTFFLRYGQHHLANETEAQREAIFSAMDIYFDVYHQIK